MTTHDDAASEYAEAMDEANNDNEILADLLRAFVASALSGAPPGNGYFRLQEFPKGGFDLCIDDTIELTDVQAAAVRRMEAEVEATAPVW